MNLRAAPPRLPPRRENILGKVEGLAIPNELLSGGGHFLVAQGGAMSRRRSLLVGGAPSDDGTAVDQRGPRIGEGFIERAADAFEIVAVARDDMPAAGAVAARNILRRRQIGAAIDGDLVIVPQDVEAAELKVAGKPDRLVIDPFHEIAIAGDHPSAVIDQIIAENGVQVPLGDRHSDRHREALPQRPRRRFDTRQHEVLRMPCAGTAKLPETSNVVHRRPLIAGQMKQRVDQHRAVPGGEHETVAVMPIGSCGSYFRYCVNRTVAASAIPIGIPGWPEFAACTASIARARIALASSLGSADMASLETCREERRRTRTFRSPAPLKGRRLRQHAHPRRFAATATRYSPPCR
jgi:hypothetical protein